jgi:hypothetical protein
MNPTDQQLAQLLREADAMSTPQGSTPLDVGRLLAMVADRRRKRTATRTVLAATVLVALVASVRFWPSSTEQVAMPAAEETSMEVLSAAIAEIETQSEQLALKLDQSFAPPQDVLAVVERARADGGQSLGQLRAELTELEAHAAATDAQLVWNRAWSRSGALRLELARQQGRIDPHQAVQSYRQIAASYPNTPWGDEAQMALAEIAIP